MAYRGDSAEHSAARKRGANRSGPLVTVLAARRLTQIERFLAERAGYSLPHDPALVDLECGHHVIRTRQMVGMRARCGHCPL